MKRWKVRGSGIADGQRRRLGGERVPSVRGKIARQASIQRETNAPSSSWVRNRAGTAIRPLSSTECRYSPVNTCLATPVLAIRAALWTDRGIGVGLVPTSHHFAPLGRAFYTAGNRRQCRFRTAVATRVPGRRRSCRGAGRCAEAPVVPRRRSCRGAESWRGARSPRVARSWAGPGRGPVPRSVDRRAIGAGGDPLGRRAISSVAGS